MIAPTNVATVVVEVEVEVTMAQAEDMEKDRQEATKETSPNTRTTKGHPIEMGNLEGSGRIFNFLLMRSQFPLILLSLYQLRYCQKPHSPIVRLTLFVTNRELNGQLLLRMFTSLSYTNLIRA